MRSRLAMVAIEDNYEGPWAWTDGMHNATVEVRGLGAGDGVSIEFDQNTAAGLQAGLIALGAGSNKVNMQGWRRYRVIKKKGDRPLPTTVEVFPEARCVSERT